MRRMMKWSVPALAVWALMTTAAQAQAIRPGPPVTMSAEAGLTVHGHSEMKVKPDIAYVEVGVVTQARDSAQAVQDNATRSTALLAALRKAGVADKDLQSQSYSVQPQYDYEPSRPAVLTGYQVSNTLRATVRDLSKVGTIIDAAAQAGGNQVNGVTFDLADRTQAEGRALGQAVTEARAKAAVMAQAAGVSLGRLRDLSEGDAPTFQPLVLATPMFRAAKSEAATPIQSQDITITADVTAVYGLGL